MKKSKFGTALVVVLTIIMVMVCTGCASDEADSEMAENQTETVTAASDDIQIADEKDDTTTETTENTIENTTESSKESTMEETTESSIESTDSQDPSELFSADEAIAIAESGFMAMNEMDPEGMVKYTNIGALYYMGNGVYMEEEKLIEEIATVLSESDSADGYNSLGVVGAFTALENVEFYDSQLLATDEIEDLNEFTHSDETNFFGEIEGFDYNIESAYKVKVNYTGVEEETFEEGNEPYVLVVYANGEWELDIFISIMKDMYEALINMDLD